MTVARTLHVGPYEALGGAYDAVTDWIRGRGFELAGPMRERYLNGPGDNVTPAEYRTEVEIPVVAAAASVPGWPRRSVQRAPEEPARSQRDPAAGLALVLEIDPGLAVVGVLVPPATQVVLFPEQPSDRAR